MVVRLEAEEVKGEVWMKLIGWKSSPTRRNGLVANVVRILLLHFSGTLVDVGGINGVVEGWIEMA
jgi:hypothetical protein